MEPIASEHSTVNVRVRFMGDLVSLTGKRSLEAALPRGSTVGDLLASLSKTYGEAYTNRVFSAPGKLRHTVVVFVDGANIRRGDGLSMQLCDSQVEVVMLPMFGGG